MVEKNSDFEIDFVSDVRFDDLMVEVSYKKQRLYQLRRYSDSHEVEIELLSDIRLLPEEVKMQFPLKEFLLSLDEAKAALLGYD